MFEVLKSGGIVMIPIFLCAFGATFIIIERILYYYKITKLDRFFHENLAHLIEKKDTAGMKNLCESTQTPCSAVIKKLLLCSDASNADLRDIGVNETSRQIPFLERYLTSLGTIANVATLLGLFGTVTGNIGAFGLLGDAGTMGNPAVLAGAISEALVTTASGLAVSIPAMIFHNYLANKANKIIITMEAEISDFTVHMKGGTSW